jgi:hypothetical protein
MPDYVEINYDCMVWTSFTEHLNSVIEQLNFTSSYWGDKNRFQFRTYIDRFDSTAEYSVNEQRVARTNMSITLYGYIIPDTMNKDMATNGKRQFFSKSTVSITNEVVKNINNVRAGNL